MTNDNDAGISCPACGHTNDADARFCNSCGRRIDSVCPSCGASNAAGSRFCGACGHDMATAASEPGPAAEQATEAGPGPVAEQASEAGPGSVAEPTTTPVTCPRCQYVNAPRAEYCFNCGLPLGAAAWPAPGVVSGAGGIPAYDNNPPAGFGIRLAAFLIDNVILTGALAVLLPILFDESIAAETQSDGALFFGSAVSFAYFTLLVGLWGATLGKRVLGVRIVRLDGSPVGIPRALGRQLATILSVFTFLVGYLMVIFRSDKRALHDLIAGTVVVRVKD